MTDSLRAVRLGAGAALAALTLAACDAGAPASSGTAAAQPILRTASAEPGPQVPPLGFARTVLQTACVDTQPAFDGATQALARAGGFVQSARSGTFFHEQFDLSVKVIPNRCSMVVGTPGGNSRIAQLAALPDVSAGRPRAFGDRTYHSFFVSGG